MTTGAHTAALERVIASSARPRLDRDSLRRRLLATADLAGISVSYVLAALVDPPAGALMDRLVLLAVLPLWIVMNKLFGLYDRDSTMVNKSTLNELGRLAHSIVLGAALVYFLNPPLTGLTVSRERAWIFVLVALVTVPLMRVVARRVAAHRAPPERCLVVGSGTVAASVVRKMSSHPEYGVDVVGSIDGTSSSKLRAVAQLPLLGGLEDMSRVCRVHDIDRVVIAFSQAISHEKLLDTVHACQRLGVKVMVVPRFFEALGSSVSVDEIEGLTLLGVGGLARTRSSLELKRLMDVVVSGFALLVLSPLIALIALAIKLDSKGPVLFRQRRIGRDQQPFMLFKFRTMVEGAEEMKDELRSMSEVAAPMFKIREDPRITRVGKLLRSRSLDELPQLFNVLRGEMSLVGPRPLVPDENEHVVGRHRSRLDIAPGLTGPWQVEGRNAIPFDEMVKMDYLYLADWSLWHDFKLMLKTTQVVLSANGH